MVNLFNKINKKWIWNIFTTILGFQKLKRKNHYTQSWKYQDIERVQNEIHILKLIDQKIHLMN